MNGAAEEGGLQQPVVGRHEKPKMAQCGSARKDFAVIGKEELDWKQQQRPHELQHEVGTFRVSELIRHPQWQRSPCARNSLVVKQPQPSDCSESSKTRQHTCFKHRHSFSYLTQPPANVGGMFSPAWVHQHALTTASSPTVAGSTLGSRAIEAGVACISSCVGGAVTKATTSAPRREVFA